MTDGALPFQLNFDFITDEQFRTSLTADYRELQACLEAEAWKAVHVLAGSIIEALLIEYLSLSKNTGKDPLKMMLGEAITACQDAGAITQRSAKLSDVVKDYRNLIHPGRVIRLKEEYGRDTAQIALSLLSMITNEIAIKRKDTYGLTAEQIVRKLMVDKGATSLIPQLIAEAHEIERRRLVKNVVWNAYNSELFLTPDSTLKMLRTCYRKALISLPTAEQREVARDFAQMVRRESAEKLATYANALFSCNDLALLEKNDVAIVKQHIFYRLDNPTLGRDSLFFAEMLEGLAQFLEKDELDKFVNLCLRFVLSSDVDTQIKFSYLLSDVYMDLQNDESKSSVMKQLESRRKSAVNADYHSDKLKALDDLIERCELEIPF
jgi:hypothetical protein